MQHKDAPDGMLTVTQHTLYELVKQSGATNGMLEIASNSAGLELMRLPLEIIGFLS